MKYAEQIRVFVEGHNPDRWTLNLRQSHKIAEDVDLTYWITAGRGRQASNRYLHVLIPNKTDIVNEAGEVLRTIDSCRHIVRNMQTNVITEVA